MKPAALALFLGSLVFGQASLYTYIQEAPGSPWKWGRLILPAGTMLTPATGKPCNSPEPCFSLSWGNVVSLPPGTAGVRAWQLVVNEAQVFAADSSTTTLGAPAGAVVMPLGVYRNGLRLTPNIDYSISGNVLTFVDGAGPLAGDLMTFDYFYSP